MTQKGLWTSILAMLFLVVLVILPLNIMLTIALMVVSILLIIFLGIERDRLFSENNLLVGKKAALQKEMDQLNKSKEDLLQVIHSLDGGVFSYFMEERKLYVSEGIERIYGYSREEFQENPGIIKETIYKEDKHIFEEKLMLLKLGEKIKLQYRIFQKNGGVRWIEVVATPIMAPDGSLHKIIGDAADITRQKQLEETLKQMAYYDELTELPNRQHLYKHLKKAIARSKRRDHQLAIVFVDLDGFKNVNDTLGHESGDQLLVEVGQRLEKSFREEDVISRLGGDEFVMVLEETSQEEVEGILERVMAVVAEPYFINGETAKITPSIGISMYPMDGETIEELIKNADKAMYHAKNRGKGQYCFYSEDLDKAEQKRFPMFEKIMESVEKIKNRG